MPINLGLYDLFANIIPGFLYLYVISEILRLLGWRTIDVFQIDTIGGVLVIAVASFMAGNIIGSLTYKYWYKVFFRKHSPELSLSRLRMLYPEIQIGFDTDDNELLFAVIRHHDKSLAERLEASRVSSIMLRNISLGLFLYGVLQIWLAIDQGQLLSFLIAGIAMMFSAISLYRAVIFNRWYFDGLFLEALNYGSTALEVLSTSKKLIAGDTVRKPRSKTNKQK